MRILDLYIIKKFLGTFFLAITLIIAIVIIFDVSEEVDDYIKHQVPLKALVFVYYFNFIPYFVNLFIALFTFVAVIFFTSKMASQSEIIAILGSGISFRRMLFPYILAASFLTVFSFVLYNFLIPPANKQRELFNIRYMGKQIRFKGRDMHIQSQPGELVYLSSYNGENNTGHLFTMEKIKDSKLFYKLSSRYLLWDTAQKKWFAKDYQIRRINENNETLTLGDTIEVALDLIPEDFAVDITNVEAMNFRELREYIDEEKIRGSGNINFYLIEKYKRIAYPFATIILTIIGVSLSSRKVRGGIGINLGIGLGISFLFILFMQVSTVFSTVGNLPPWVAVWIPNIIFFAVGLFLLRKAPK